MRPTRALIHRRNLLSNLAEIRRVLPAGTALCAAVKADAYGHSATLVSPWVEAEGVEAFGVATVDEGLELREAGIRGAIYLLGSVQPEELSAAIDGDLDLFVWTREAVDAVASAARGRKAPSR